MNEEMKTLIISLIAGNKAQIALLQRQVEDFEALIGPKWMRGTEGVEPLGNAFHTKGD